MNGISGSEFLHLGLQLVNLLAVRQMMIIHQLNLIKYLLKLMKMNARAQIWKILAMVLLVVNRAPLCLMRSLILSNHLAKLIFYPLIEGKF
jgi:hypothetical protein